MDADEADREIIAGDAEASPAKLAFWHPDRLGDRLFGKRAYRSYIKPYYRQTTAVSALLSGISDVFGKISPFISVLLISSVAFLAAFGIAWTITRSIRCVAGFWLSGLASIVFGMMYGLHLWIGGTLTSSLPLGDDLQTRLSTLVARVDSLNSTVAKAGADISASRQSLGRMEEMQRATMPPMMLQRLRDAIVLADGAELAKISSEGFGGQNAQRLLQDEQTAYSFFDKALQDPSALDWLKSALVSGLDPDMLVQRSDRSREGLLITAFRAGNGAAMIALLEAGANPHAYQRTSFYPQEMSFFISPLNSVIEDSNLSEDDKKSILKLMVHNGVLLPAAIKGRGESWEDGIAEKLKSYGVAAPARPEYACDTPRAAACSNDRLKGSPFCDFRKSIPAKLNFSVQKDRPEMSFVVGLLGVYDRVAYYRMNAPNAENYTQILAVSPDRRNLTAFKYVSPWSGGNIVCSDINKSEDRYCWIPESLDFEPASGQLSKRGWKLQSSYCPWKLW